MTLIINTIVVCKNKFIQVFDTFILQRHKISLQIGGWRCTTKDKKTSITEIYSELRWIAVREIGFSETNDSFLANLSIVRFSETPLFLVLFTSQILPLTERAPLFSVQSLFLCCKTFDTSFWFLQNLYFSIFQSVYDWRWHCERRSPQRKQCQTLLHENLKNSTSHSAIQLINRDIENLHFSV